MLRKIRALLNGCGVFSIVVLACCGSLVAQSHHAKLPGAHRTAAGTKFAESADVARFRQRVETALSASGPDKGFWGVLVTDAATGEILYARNAESYFTPASDAKLFTTALALASLGPDYRVRTTIESTGPLDANGMLSGSLVLVGRGDANLSNRKFPYVKKEEREGPPDKVFAELVDAIAARGVKEIRGDVIADDRMFKYIKFPSGWLADDLLWSYGAAVSAVTINDNVHHVTLRPGARQGDPGGYEEGLATEFYVIENSVLTTARGTEEKLSVSSYPGSRALHISGTMPLGAPPRKLSFGIEEPAEYAAYVLLRLLEARGVQVDGRVLARHAEDPPTVCDHCSPGEVIAEHTGVSVADDVRLTNKNSENLHAELLLLLSAHEKTGATNYDEATKFEAEFLKSAGVADGDVVLTDGSGLSRKDLVTPRAVVQLLRYASTQPWGELFRTSLPIAGEDGTLSERMKNTAAEGRIFAKTGTIEHVVALSGYATTTRGEHLIFSILGNNNSLHAQTADAFLDSIAIAMVEELGSEGSKGSKGGKGNEGPR